MSSVATPNTHPSNTSSNGDKPADLDGKQTTALEWGRTLKRVPKVNFTTDAEKEVLPVKSSITQVIRIVKSEPLKEEEEAMTAKVSEEAKEVKTADKKKKEGKKNGTDVKREKNNGYAKNVFWNTIPYNPDAKKSRNGDAKEASGKTDKGPNGEKKSYYLSIPSTKKLKGHFNSLAKKVTDKVLNSQPSEGSKIIDSNPSFTSKEDAKEFRTLSSKETHYEGQLSQQKPYKPSTRGVNVQPKDQRSQRV